jgi:hypothetical protein
VRNQLEFAAPYNFLQRDNKSWVGGIGDLVIGYKRVVLSRKSVNLQLARRGRGADRKPAPGIGGRRNHVRNVRGVRTCGLTDSSFIQIQTGADLPVNTEKAPQAVFFHTAIGNTFAQNHGFGRIGRRWWNFSPTAI